MGGGVTETILAPRRGRGKRGAPRVASPVARASNPWPPYSAAFGGAGTEQSRKRPLGVIAEHAVAYSAGVPSDVPGYRHHGLETRDTRVAWRGLGRDSILPIPTARPNRLKGLRAC